MLPTLRQPSALHRRALSTAVVVLACLVAASATPARSASPEMPGGDRQRAVAVRKPAPVPPATAPRAEDTSAGGGPPSPPDPAPAGAGEVRLHGDRLTLHVHDVQLDEILRRITEAGGGRLEGSLRSSRAVTIDLDDAPLQDALARLLGDQNFVLVYRADGRLSRLTLLGGPLEVPPTRIVKSDPEAGAERPPAGGLLQRSIVLAPGPVKRHLGRPRATLQELIDLAFRNDDQKLRLDAMRTGIKAVNDQPELNEMVSTALQRMDDAALTAAIQSMAGPHAHEMLLQIAGQARDSELRLRSMRLLQQLSAAP